MVVEAARIRLHNSLSRIGLHAQQRRTQKAASTHGAICSLVAIFSSDVQKRGVNVEATGSLTLPGPNQNLTSMIEDYERKLIVLALEAAGGHQRRAAASLGIRPTTLSEKLRRLGLRQRRKRFSAEQSLQPAGALR